MRRKAGGWGGPGRDVEPFAGNLYALWIMNFNQTLRRLLTRDFIMRINIEAKSYAEFLTNPSIEFCHRQCYAADL
jgi:hypothetical protein